MAENDTTIQYKQGEIIYSPNEDIDQVFLITKGRITAYAPYGTLTMGTGAIAGLTDNYYGISIYTYVAETDVTVQSFTLNNISDVSKISNLYKDNLGHLTSIQHKHIIDLIRNYLTLVVKCRKKNPEYTMDTRINKWELDKYNGIDRMDSDICEQFYSFNTSIATAALIESARFATVINDACLEMADMLGINMDYIPPVIKEEPKPAPVPEAFSSEEEYVIEEDVNKQLEGSLRKILDYSRMNSDDTNQYFALITHFKKLQDKLSQDESVRRIRKEITDGFYKLYYNVFLASLDDDNIPPYIKMFLNFGYIDEELLSTRNLITLYKLAHNIDDVCNSEHVFTIYNWLKHIMWNEKEPSKNGFDQSYSEYIKELIRNGKLEISEHEALNDTDMKLKFEISNMFTSGHRIACGRISSFVPILVEDNIYKPLDKSFLTAEDITNAVNQARSIDFSLFYRSIVYSNEALGLSKEYIYTEVLPNIILMPCIGTNGAMWQEIEGRHRNSSARFMIPIFCATDINSILLNVFGKYRWELCKRIQGTYWNNISERSLTSEYYDYLQFYKKNRDLSDNAKEKLKSTLINCRNNYAEVFAKDYEQWIANESKGGSKLNRVARVFMGKYCPFNSKIRDALKFNPAYTEAFEAYERYKASQKKHFDLLSKTLIAKGHEIPNEIKETIAFLSR